MRRRGPGSLTAFLAAPAFLTAFVALVGGAALLRGGGAEAVDPRTGCPTAGHAKLTVLAVDASDPLAPMNQAMAREVVTGAAAQGRDSRVIVARISGSAQYRPEILFDRCNPGAADEARGVREGAATRQAIFDEDFKMPLDKAIEKLGRPTTENPLSYLSDTISRMIADPAMHLDSGERKLILLSDLIENTPQSQPFVTGKVRLRRPSEPFLRGISLDLMELPALPEATSLQSFATRAAWRQWCIDAGALSCRIIAPGIADAAVMKEGSRPNAVEVLEELEPDLRRRACI